MEGTVAAGPQGPTPNGRFDTPGTIEPPPAGLEEQAKRLGVGAGAPPPPPPAPSPANIRLPHEPPARPPTAAEVDIRKTVEALQQQGWKPPRRQAPKVRRPLSNRTKTGLAVLAAMAATGVVFRAVTPSYPSTDQITAAATRAAYAAAQESTAAELAKAKAESTQLIVPDPFAWCRCDLDGTAKTIISYDAATNYKTLVTERAQFVSDRAVELIMAGVPPMRIKVVGDGPSGLKVVDGGPQGAPLFATPPAQSQPASTTPTSGG